MNKKIIAANILLATSFCFMSVSAMAETDMKQNYASNEVSALSARSVMNDIKAAVPADAIDGYSPEEILDLWKQLQPELTDEIINKFGEETVLQFISTAMDYIESGNVPANLPDFSDIINNETVQKYIKELKVFLGQVVPLYAYQFGNRKTPQMADESIYTVKNVYDTPKDACFYGVGDSRNTYDPYGIDCEECKANGGKPKANGSYVWGMATDGKKLYWGTNNNYLCQSGMNSVIAPGMSGAIENSCYVCEFDKGQRSKELAAEDPKLAKFGDIMPPRLFCYDPATGVVKDISPDDNTLGHNQGIRSAIYYHGIVFFGGPDFSAGSNAAQATSSTFVAYSTEQEKIIGKSNMSSVEGYNITNVRKWLIVDDVLYCGVGIMKDGYYSGAVLRWTGSVDEPFKFEIVGYTSCEAAEIEYHNGHIYVAGWNIAEGGREASTLYKSPEVPAGGFTAANATEWEKVWKYSDYDEKPIISTAILGLKSFKGKLYWGTYSSSYTIPLYTLMKYKTLTSADAIAFVLGSLRGATLFCSENPDGNPASVEMLYGEKQLPVYDSETGSWTLKENVSGYTPKWGRSGYGNPYTSYTWTLTEYNDKLFIGTMDISNMISPFLETIGKSNDSGETKDMASLLKRILRIKDSEMGYECLVLKDNDTEPEYITTDGFGNHAAYGIRNMEVLDNKIFIGTSNPQNLNEQGGWQILSLEEDNGTSSISTPVKEVGIMLKQNEYYLEFSSMKGEKIMNITLSDMAGKTVADSNYGRTLATVITANLPKGIYVANIKTESDSYSIKVTVK